MVTLNLKEKVLLVMFTLWYLLAIQFFGQQMINDNSSVIAEGNIFKTKEIMFLFLNAIILLCAITFLLFQAFLYRFIILLFKPNKYPSILLSFFYLIIGYLPFSLTIIILNFVNQEYVYIISTSLYSKIPFTIIVNLIYIFLIVRKGMLDIKKSLVCALFLMLLNGVILFINFNLS